MATEKKKFNAKILIKAALIVAAVCLGLYFATLKRYYALIVAFCGIYAIGITGLDILFGYTGQISFGHAGFFAIGSYAVGIMCTKLGTTPILAILVGTVLAVIIGFIIAYPASKLVKHFLSLLTTAFGQIIYLLLNSAHDFTGGAAGIRSIPEINLGFMMIDTNFKYAIFTWIFVFVAFIIKGNIINSRVGYAFLAIKENPIAANGLGINTRKYKMMAFAISAAFMGFAGGIYACLVGFISPETYSSAQSTLFMTMLLFGGICTLGGPIIGAVFLIVIREFLQTFSQYQTLIYGIFLLAILFWFPNGIIGLFKQLEAAVKKGLTKKEVKEEASK